MSTKRTRLPAEKPGRGGWSRWIMPVMKKYFVQCCDCGLTHEVQFRAYRQTTKTRPDGTFRVKPIVNGRVEFRARRAE